MIFCVSNHWAEIDILKNMKQQSYNFVVLEGFVPYVNESILKVSIELS